MGRFLPSPQQVLVFVVERGETVLPIVAVLALLAALWSWRRRRALVRYGAGSLLALVGVLALAALVFAHTVRGELRQRTLDLRFQTLDDAKTHQVLDWRGEVIVVNY